MGLFVEAVDVWAAPIPDRPGGLAEALKALHDAGADLQCVISRRAPDQPGKGVVFVTPLQGDQEIAAAAQVGFSASHTVHSVRVTGRDRPGIAANVPSGTPTRASARCNAAISGDIVLPCPVG